MEIYILWNQKKNLWTMNKQKIEKMQVLSWLMFKQGNTFLGVIYGYKYGITYIIWIFRYLLFYMKP